MSRVHETFQPLGIEVLITERYVTSGIESVQVGPAHYRTSEGDEACIQMDMECQLSWTLKAQSIPPSEQGSTPLELETSFEDK
jgi:hypothetical protein